MRLVFLKSCLLYHAKPGFGHLVVVDTEHPAKMLGCQRSRLQKAGLDFLLSRKVMKSGSWLKV